MADILSANNYNNSVDLIANFVTLNEVAWADNAAQARLAQTAQQEQPSAPKKPLRSAIGSFDVQAPAWSWP